MAKTEFKDTLSDDSKKKRIRINNKWPKKILFEIEKVYEDRISNFNEGLIFTPVKFNFTDDQYFHRSLAYILDALDFYPNRPDLSFDFVWRGIDSLSKEILKSKFSIEVNATQSLLETIKRVWIPYLNADLKFEQQFLKLIASIPVQSCEYLFKRIYSDFELPNRNRVSNRLTQINGRRSLNIEAEDILIKMHNKFNLSDNMQIRNGAFVFKKFFSNEELELNGSKYKFDLEQKLNFIINGILYTYRNDRSHGGVFSPFRSSVCKLRTYAHCNFCFLVTYYLLIMLMNYRQELIVDKSKLLKNINYNILLFQKFYGRSLKNV